MLSINITNKVWIETLKDILNSNVTTYWHIDFLFVSVRKVLVILLVFRRQRIQVSVITHGFLKQGEVWYIYERKYLKKRLEERFFLRRCVYGELLQKMESHFYKDVVKPHIAYLPAVKYKQTFCWKPKMLSMPIGLFSRLYKLLNQQLPSKGYDTGQQIGNFSKFNKIIKICLKTSDKYQSWR